MSRRPTIGDYQPAIRTQGVGHFSNVTLTDRGTDLHATVNDLDRWVVPVCLNPLPDGTACRICDMTVDVANLGVGGTGGSFTAALKLVRGGQVSTIGTGSIAYNATTLYVQVDVRDPVSGKGVQLIAGDVIRLDLTAVPTGTFTTNPTGLKVHFSVHTFGVDG